MKKLSFCKCCNRVKHTLSITGIAFFMTLMAAGTVNAAVSAAANMKVSLSHFPVVAANGATVTGVISCINSGTTAAASATCSVSTGSLSNCTQLPGGNSLKLPISLSSLPIGGSVSCTVTATAPTSGNLSITGSTGAHNQSSSNSVTTSLPVIDAVNDSTVTLTVIGGVVTVLNNDTYGTVPVVVSGSSANINVPTIYKSGGLTGLAFNKTGQLVVPAGSTPGNYTVVYKICSVQAAQICSTATVGIDVLDVPPLAKNDVANTLPVTSVVVLASANDSSWSGTSLNLASIDLDPATTGQQTAKTIVGEGIFTTSTTANNGQVIFTPNTGFLGVVTVPYTIADELGQVSNSANITISVEDSSSKIIANDDYASTNANTSVTLPVLKNDVALSGESLLPATVKLIDPADSKSKSSVTTASGQWSVDNTTGDVIFTPNRKSTGIYTLTYTVQDNQADVSNAATITVSVTGGATPVAVDDGSSTKESTPVSFAILDNDAASNGFSLEYGTVNLSVSTPASPQTSVTAAEGGWVVDASGLVTFTPTSNYKASSKPFTGLATLQYTVKDTGNTLSNMANINVAVNPISVSAIDDAYVTPINTAVILTPTINDIALANAVIDASTVNLAAAVNSSPVNSAINRGVVTTSQGTWMVTDNYGTVLFTPKIGYTGNATLNYAVSDSLGNRAIATMTVSVAPPVGLNVVNETISTTQNQLVYGSVTSQGSIPTGSTITANSQPSFGSLAFYADGSYSYTPNTGYSGNDQFTYKACLPSADLTSTYPSVCATAYVYINVSAIKPQSSLTLSALTLSIPSSRPDQLNVTGGSGSGAISVTAVPVHGANCQLRQYASIWYLVITTQVGSCNITATKAGDGTYGSASSNMITVTVQ